MSIPGFGGGTDPSGIESALTSLVPQFQNLSSQAAALEPNFLNLASNFATEGGQIFGPSFNQFNAGATGNVTPDQQADIDRTLQQQNLSTTGTYGNLGLGGSTMKTQDLNANKSSSLAQKSAFESLDEQLGLGGLSSALGFGNAADTATGGALSALTGAGSILGGAAGTLNSAGNIATQQQQLQLGLLSSLGSALGGSQGLLGKLGLGGSGYSGGGIFGYGGGGAGAGAGYAGLSAADIAGGTGAIF